MTRPTVSVNIAVKNRRALVARCLDALAEQTWRDFEVVVVDNGSTDGTLDELRRRAADATTPYRLSVVSCAGSLGAARNAGVAASQGEIVAFVDSDCVPERRWLERGVEVFRASGDRVATVQGLTLPDPDAALGRWHVTQHIVEFTNRYEACNVFYRRAVLLEAGGFDETIGFFGEDTTAGWAVHRLGHEARFAGDAIVFHAVSHPGLRWHLRRGLRYRNWNALVRRFPELRNELWHRFFLRPASAQTLLAFAGAVTGTAAVVTNHVVFAALGLAAVAPFAWRHRPYTWRRRSAIVDALGGAAFDVAIELGLLWGSITQRTLLL
jgi:glycosyltransferase involved in cell wall biosynthesis